MIPSISQIGQAMEELFVMEDWHNLGEHYDKTLKAWLDRFLDNRAKVKNLYSERFCKMWEFYLASCSAAFKYRDLLVYQLQIVKDFSAVPNNRRDYIYN
ncbi:MAG: hypothetical protein HOI42_15005 [Candidatus Marinimicrobia bacterium]|nr:hypothetical protein [Candidatus Neomarinimicrobiota bacterium]